MLNVIARRLAFAQAVVACLAPIAAAGPYDAPAGYYASATGTGATLKSQLHNVIDNHTVFSYGDARTILQDTDRDPADPGRMLLVYDRVSLDVSSINPGGSIPGWDFGNSWNREHTWPRSRSVGSSGPDSSDLHQLRPSDPGVNNDRGNSNFGGSFGQPFGDVGAFWYPGDADAGMIARQMFYMAVRYDGSDSATEDLELSAGNPSSGLGDLDSLLDWHYRVAPDNFERRRNDVIYDDYQGNRNPFVDHPEFVWSVFVDQANDTRLSLAGEATSADGSSTRAIDLGRVYVGGAGPATQTVGLNKAGVDGTYYRVTTTGDAFTTAGEDSRPVAMGAMGGTFDSFDVGLSASTVASGVYTGAVFVDNLDVTTGGGVGRGANDGDDVVGLSSTVLDHPVASFDDETIASSLTIDFGQIDLGSGLLEESFSLFNYAGPGGPTLASDLDLDGVGATGDAGAFGLDFAPATGLEQGEAFSFDASFDPMTAGLFSSVYTLTLSGEDLPGEQLQTVNVTFLAEVLAGLEGDYNGDGLVNAADYVVYRNTFGSTTDLAADGDGSGEVDAADLALWRDNYGASAPPAAGVPEPASALLVLVVGSAVRAIRKTSQRS